MLDKLVEIPVADWPALRDLYKEDWPRNHVGYYTLDNFIRWVNLDPNIKHLKVLSLNGDWSDGTFVIIDRYQLFLNSLNPSNEKLVTALNLLDWTNGYKVSSFLQRHRPAVLDVVESKKLEKEYDSLTVLYYLPRADAEQFDISCPDELTLRPMVEEDAKTADDIWPNKHEGSWFFLKRLINWNPNIGVYTKQGELVAWSFRLQAGFLGALQVKDSYKRRGLGSLVVKVMAKKLAAMGHDTTALVGEANLPSRKLFESLGFKLLDTAYWLRTYPLNDFHWVDE